MALPNAGDGLGANGDPMGGPPTPDEIAAARDVFDRLGGDDRGDQGGQGQQQSAPDAGTGGGPLPAAPDGGAIRRLDGGTPDVGNGRPLSPEERAWSDAHPQGGSWALKDPLGPVEASNILLPNVGGQVTSAPTPPSVDATHFITRLGDSGNDGTTGGVKKNAAEGTTAFYQGEYTPGKGVADADGYYDPAFMSTANVVNNAKQGDPAALAKLEVISKSDPAAKAIFDDLGGLAFAGGQQNAVWEIAHNKQINNALAQGMDAGNIAARANLASQRETPTDTVLPLKEADPPAYELMNALGDMGASKITYTPDDGVSFVSDGVKKNIPIGEIVTTLPKVKELVAASTPPPVA